MDALNTPLDTLVKKSKMAGRGGGRLRRGRGGRAAAPLSGRGGGFIGKYLGPRTSGLFRKASRFRGTSAASFNASKPNRGGTAGVFWQQSFLDDAAGARLFVSNLDSGVSNEDIKELFSEVGDLKYCAVHYDKNGRSKGTAEVSFMRREHALIAMKRYNNVQLDGKPMVIDVIGSGAQLASSLVPVVPAPARLQRPAFVPRGAAQMMSRAGVGAGAAAAAQQVGAVRGRGVRGRGRGRGRRGGGRSGGAAAPQKTVDELNAELDKYHHQAMDTA